MDPELAEVMRAWPSLCGAARDEVLRQIRAGRGNGGAQ